MVKVGCVYKLKYAIDEGSNDYLPAGTKVLVESIDDQYVFFKEITNKPRAIDDYTLIEDLEGIEPEGQAISPTIYPSDLKFLEEAKEQLSIRPELYTYRNDQNTHIALRMGESIQVFRIKDVAYFEDLLKTAKGGQS